jgi:hypothetical protein
MNEISTRQGPLWWPLCRVVASVVALGALAGSLGPAAASANYTVNECVPNIVGAPDSYVVEGGAPKIYVSNECTGGARPGWGLGLESNGQTPQNNYSSWNFTAPPNTYFATAQATVHQNANFGYGGLYTCSSTGTQGFGSEWNTPTCANTPYFQVSLHCFASPCQSPGGAGDFNLTGGWVFVSNFLASVVDTSPPAVSASGEILSGDVVRGVQNLQLGVSDSGGGAQHATVYVNGVVSRETGAFCGPGYNGYYIVLHPCPDSWAGTLALDTAKDPGWTNGPNDVRICAYDVGGNESSCVRRTVQVDNSCPASGGTAAAKLDSGADISGGLRPRASVTSNEQPVIRGELRDGAGDPVSGATVCIYETVDLPDASREMATEVTTQPSGRFATKLDAGPSRDIDLVYRYNDRALTDEVELDSRVVPTLKVPDARISNGHAARFKGRLPGPNADGRAIALQARAGRKWRTFKQLRSDLDGVFHGKYRFTRTTGRQVYAFRVLIKRQNGYPYEPGSSRKRKLVVRG